jgi:phosphoenolpyruvate carboxykinase (ATP)
VGSRMSLKYTRRLLDEAISGNLDQVEYENDPVFGLSIPKEVNGVPSAILIPRNTWEDKHAYDKKANQLASMFVENFKQFEEKASREILDAAPYVSE